MKQAFIEKRFTPVQLQLIEACNLIITKFAAQGFDLSLRQLYYQLVTLNVLANCTESYTMLGKLVSDGRMAGLIDWTQIVDRGRTLRRPLMWSSAEAAMIRLSQDFKLNRWKDQPYFIEVMVEKQALEGVLLPVCAGLGIGFTSNKGYSSMTALYEAAQRYLQAIKRGKKVCVLYLGDHDPSGCDMTRDIRDRLALFCGQPIDVKRLSLNKSQIEEHNIPHNPAKMSDSRAGDYVQKHGQRSWELDAIPPMVLAGYVRAAVHRRLDKPAWEQSAKKELRAKASIMAAALAIKRHSTKKPSKDDEADLLDLPLPQDLE